MSWSNFGWFIMGLQLNFMLIALQFSYKNIGSSNDRIFMFVGSMICIAISYLVYIKPKNKEAGK